MKIDREKTLIGVAFVLLVLVGLSITVIWAGHTPIGKANEWIDNEATMVSAAVAMPAAGVGMAVVRRLAFRSVMIAWVLNAMAVVFLVRYVCIGRPPRIWLGSAATLLAFMFITFLVGYGLPKIFMRQAGSNPT